MTLINPLFARLGDLPKQSLDFLFLFAIDKKTFTSLHIN